MASKPPRPQPLREEDTHVEQPRAAKPEVRRVLGKIADEDSVTLSAPVGLKKGLKQLPRAAVGVRALPVESTGTNARALEQRDVSRERVEGVKEERRQRVWSKLDDAKDRAQSKADRMKKFEPPRR